MQGSDVLELNGRHLRLFLMLLDRRSLTEACRDLSIDAADASALLDDLRRILKDDLFIRAGRKYSPTEHALQIEPVIRENLALLESLSAPRSFDPGEDAGRITIAANVTELLDEVAQIRDSILKDAPSAAIRFLELGARDNIEPMLESGDADVVITIRAQEYASSLNGCPFSFDNHVVFYDPTSRAPIHSVEDYAEAEHATLDFGHGGKSTIDTVLERESLSRCVALSAPDVTTLAALIKGTRLISTMQSRLSRTIFSELAYCEAPIYLPTQHFDLVWHRRAENSPRSKWLRELILRVAEASQYARD